MALPIAAAMILGVQADAIASPVTTQTIPADLSARNGVNDNAEQTSSNHQVEANMPTGEMTRQCNPSVKLMGDLRIANSTNAIFMYLEGAFGAVFLLVAALGSIAAAALGFAKSNTYLKQLSLGLLAVAVAVFICRVFIGSLFTDI